MNISVPYFLPKRNNLYSNSPSKPVNDNAVHNLSFGNSATKIKNMSKTMNYSQLFDMLGEAFIKIKNNNTKKNMLGYLDLEVSILNKALSNPVEFLKDSFNSYVSNLMTPASEKNSHVNNFIQDIFENGWKNRYYAYTHPGLKEKTTNIDSKDIIDINTLKIFLSESKVTDRLRNSKLQEIFQKKGIEFSAPQEKVVSKYEKFNQQTNEIVEKYFNSNSTEQREQLFTELLNL